MVSHNNKARRDEQKPQLTALTTGCDFKVLLKRVTKTNLLFVHRENKNRETFFAHLNKKISQNNKCTKAQVYKKLGRTTPVSYTHLVSFWLNLYREQIFIVSQSCFTFKRRKIIFFFFFYNRKTINEMAALQVNGKRQMK